MADLRLVRGSLHVPREVYDAFLGGVEGCALLRDGDALLILPVRHLAGGGHLLKVRNAAGDRVVTAPDFFREHGVEEDRDVRVEWRDDRAGLVGSGFFPTT